MFLIDSETATFGPARTAAGEWKPLQRSAAKCARLVYHFEFQDRATRRVQPREHHLAPSL